MEKRFQDSFALCYRCEKRAKYLEGLPGAYRHECKDLTRSVGRCYQFEPVKPICVKPQENDDRPMTLNIFSCRVQRVPDVYPEMVCIPTPIKEKECFLISWNLREIVENK